MEKETFICKNCHNQFSTKEYRQENLRNVFRTSETVTKIVTCPFCGLNVYKSCTKVNNVEVSN